jgi:lipopolysaccharide export system protein LptA
MLSDYERAQMANNRAALIDDAPASVVIRRESTTLAAQQVRIVRSGGRASQPSGSGTSAAHHMTLIYGEATLDIQRGDRLTYHDQVYRVTAVRPSKLGGVAAEAEAVE